MRFTNVSPHGEGCCVSHSIARKQVLCVCPSTHPQPSPNLPLLQTSHQASKHPSRQTSASWSISPVFQTHPTDPSFHLPTHPSLPTRNHTQPQPRAMDFLLSFFFFLVGRAGVVLNSLRRIYPSLHLKTHKISLAPSAGSLRQYPLNFPIATPTPSNLNGSVT